jgi:hypothetical protein
VVGYPLGFIAQVVAFLVRDDYAEASLRPWPDLSLPTKLGTRESMQHKKGVATFRASKGGMQPNPVRWEVFEGQG